MATIIHKILAHLLGQPGGQTLIGSTLTGEDLTLQDNAVDGNTTSVTLIKAGLLSGTQKGDLTDGNDSTLHYHAADRNTDNHTDGSTNKVFSATEQTKLAGIEAGAEVNNISDVNATDLTDAGDSTLHYHAADRNTDNHVTGSTNTVVTIAELAIALKAPYVDIFTYDLSTASGNIVRTGIGGTPKALLIEYYSTATTYPGTCRGSGSDDGTRAACTYEWILAATNVPYHFVDTSYSVHVYDHFQGGPNIFHRVEIKAGSFDSDGYTLAATKTGSPDGTLTMIVTCLF